MQRQSHTNWKLTHEFPALQLPQIKCKIAFSFSSPSWCLTLRPGEELKDWITFLRRLSVLPEVVPPALSMIAENRSPSCRTLGGCLSEPRKLSEMFRNDWVSLSMPRAILVPAPMRTNHHLIRTWTNIKLKPRNMHGNQPCAVKDFHQGLDLFALFIDIKLWHSQCDKSHTCGPCVPLDGVHWKSPQPHLSRASGQ